ncbi:hypothetical protein CRG98_038906, partial [Punica granatum]
MTLTLPRDEVVTCQEPLNRARPPLFQSFSLPGFHSFYRFLFAFPVEISRAHATNWNFAGAYRSARVESHYEPPINVILRTYRSARAESFYEPPITVLLSQLGVQCHPPSIKRPPGASCGAISSSGASRKIYACSPPETTADAILSLLGIQRNWPRVKILSRSTGTAPTSQTASRIYQSTRLHRFGSVRSSQVSRLPLPLLRLFPRVPGL